MTPARVTAITGANAGIGAATARRLAAGGDRVILAARREDALAAVVAEIEAAGGQAAALGVDVTRAADLRALVDFAVERFGRLDALVANAGVATVAPLADGDLADWDQMIDVNLRGVMHGIAAALPVFAAQGSGHFLTVTSTSSVKWVPGQAVYAASKAGVRALCEVLRQEVGPEIRVTMVCPGATATAFISGQPGEEISAEDRARRDQYMAIAMAPEAVADAIAYALDQPAGVNVGEIVVRSAAQP
jgi:NADP-dependent 3-hydroxy acid dehydrogenase YdfG